MNRQNKFFPIGVGIVILGGVFVLNQLVVQPLLTGKTIETVLETPVVVGEYDVAFTYPSGVEGFKLIEPPIETTSQSLRKAYLLFEYSRFFNYQNTQAGSQTPPAVSVFVFALPEKTAADTGSRFERLLQWIDENPQYTSFNKKVGEITEVKIDGVVALKYSTVGLYSQDFHIVSYSGNAYIFASQYEAEATADVNRIMYNDLIASVTFY
jgi:hypothetical protein